MAPRTERPGVPDLVLDRGRLPRDMSMARVPVILNSEIYAVVSWAESASVGLGHWLKMSVSPTTLGGVSCAWIYA